MCEHERNFEFISGWWCLDCGALKLLSPSGDKAKWQLSESAQAEQRDVNTTYFVQGCYDDEWTDGTEHDTLDEARHRLNRYQSAYPKRPLRIVKKETRIIICSTSVIEDKHRRVSSNA